MEVYPIKAYSICQNSLSLWYQTSKRKVCNLGLNLYNCYRSFINNYKKFQTLKINTVQTMPRISELPNCPRANNLACYADSSQFSRSNDFSSFLVQKLQSCSHNRLTSALHSLWFTDNVNSLQYYPFNLFV